MQMIDEKGRERERERNALPFARYRIVTRAFTRRTPPQDGRGADLCQSPGGEESLKSIPRPRGHPTLIALAHPREGREEEGTPSLLSRVDLGRFCPRKRLFKTKLKRPPLPLSMRMHRCHYESFRCSAECNVLVLSLVARN